MPALMGKRLASSHGQSARHLRGLPLQFQAGKRSPTTVCSPSPEAIASVPGDSYAGRLRCLAISRDYRFNSRSACFCGSSRTRHLRGLPLQFQAGKRSPTTVCSPSPGAIASVPGLEFVLPQRALAISGDYRFRFTGYRFTLDGATPKPPRGERNSSSIAPCPRESAHKGPGVLNHRANEPSMTICALLCPR